MQNGMCAFFIRLSSLFCSIENNSPAFFCRKVAQVPSKGFLSVLLWLVEAEECGHHKRNEVCAFNMCLLSLEEWHRTPAAEGYKISTVGRRSSRFFGGEKAHVLGCHAPGAPGKGYLSAPFFQSPLNYLTRPWGGLEGPHRHMECLFVP